MPNKTLPEFRVRAYTVAAIPQRTKQPLIINDLMGNNLTLGNGSSSGLLVTPDAALPNNPTVSDAWFQQQAPTTQQYIAISNAEFVRFDQDGSVQLGTTVSAQEKVELGGWIIQPREAFLDCRAGVNAETLSGGRTPLHWTFDATACTFRTGLRPEAPTRTRIMNSGADILAQSHTVGNIPANRCLGFDARFLGAINISIASNQTYVPAYRLAWGNNKYSICFRHRQFITFEKMINGVWCILMRMPALGPANLSNGHYIGRILRIAGRVVIFINQHGFSYLEMNQPASVQTQPSPIESTWSAGILSLNCWNVRAETGISVIQWSDADGNLLTGSFDKTYSHPEPISDSGSLVGYPQGWRNGGTHVDIAISVPSRRVNTTTTMTGGTDGIDTPFVSGQKIYGAPVWSDASLVPLDITPACLGGVITQAHPPIQPGTEVSLDFNRRLLDSLSNTWTNYVDRYHPIDIAMRWHYDNGTHDGSWTPMFKGYITVAAKSTGGVNDNLMTLTCHDSIIRLIKPAATIDFRYPPMDTVIMEQVAVNPLAKTYGSDFVKRILEIAIGPDEANALTVYYANSMYPLFSADSDVCGYVGNPAVGQPPIKSFPLFPVPWNDDALTWINKIGQLDRCIFYYGYPGGISAGAGWPVPIYGRLIEIQKHFNQAVLELPDSGSVIATLIKADVTTQPGKDINRILVYANVSGKTNANPFLPADRIGVARLGADDINSAEKTWERTLIVSDNAGPSVGAVEAIAAGIKNEIANRNIVFPTFTIRGQETLQWGRLVKLKQQVTRTGDYPDLTLGLNQVVVRCERVQQKFSLDPSGATLPEFVTTIWPRVLSAAEQAALGL